MTLRSARAEVMREELRTVSFDHLDITIFKARYGGGYEGGKWLAWCGETEWLDEAQGGDIECMHFWSDYKDAPVGRGETPNDALADLRRQKEAI